MTTPAPRRPLAGSPFAASPPAAPHETYELDDSVSHDRYGLGRVVRVEGTSSVCVRFGSQVRRVHTSSAKLVKL